MRIGVLSYNLAEVENLTGTISDKSIIKEKPDIYIEMTQEDPRPPNSPPLLKSELLKNYTRVAYHSVNKDLTRKKNIIIKMYVKGISTSAATNFSKTKQNPLSSRPPNNTQKIILKNVNTYEKNVSPNTLYTKKGVGQYVTQVLGVGYSKGMVCIIANISGRKCIFVNMHLPVQSRYNDMGYDYRKEKLFELLNMLKSKYGIDPTTFLFIGGDLNFRMNFTGYDQLTTLLTHPNLPIRLDELCFPKSSGKRITCKFEVTKIINPIRRGLCRTRKMPINEPITQFLEGVQRNCGVSDRVPSRCDRFLVYPSKVIKTVLIHEAKDLLKASDHNGLLACFDLKPLKQTHSLSEILGKGPCDSSLMDPPQSTQEVNATTPSNYA